jgi:hypothetical protein
MWYCRHEIQFRQALFFSAASIAGAFSGLLAFGIAKMDGIAGLEGWRWIFILEGIVTVVVAIFAFWALYDFPETASFLTEEERAFVVFRLKYQGQQQTAGHSQARVAQTDEFKWKYVWDAFKDWQIWVNIFVYWGVSQGRKPTILTETDTLQDRMPSLRNQLVSTDYHQKPRIQFVQSSVDDCANLYHSSHSRCDRGVDIGSSWQEESVHRGIPLCHDCWILHVSIPPFLLFEPTLTCTGASLPTTPRWSTEAFSSQLAPSTQHSPASLHGFPTTYQEVTSAALEWLFRLVLEISAV